MIPTFIIYYETSHTSLNSIQHKAHSFVKVLVRFSLNPGPLKPGSDRAQKSVSLKSSTVYQQKGTGFHAE